MGGQKYATWEKVVSCSVTNGNVPVGAVTIYLDDDGTFGEWHHSVLGVVTRIVDIYRRRAREEWDSGNPTRPPSARNLLEEGYVYCGRETRFAYLLFHGEFGMLPHDDDMWLHENSEMLLYPLADGKPDPEIRSETEDRLRRIRHAAQSGNGRIRSAKPTSGGL